MLKIGVQMCGYDCEEYIDKVLAPWMEVKNNKKHNFIFSVIYAQFKEWAELFGEDKELNCSYLDNYQHHFDYFEKSTPKSEAEIKNIALQPLLKENCDYILMLDLSDEFYNVDQILAAIEFMEKFPDIYYFDVAFKNYIFDDKHYLDTIFFKRFFRNPCHDKLVGMRFDCDFVYESGSDETKPRMKIPEQIIKVDHYSWFSNERGKRKVEYQTKRWGKNFCSYQWNDKENKLEINYDHYLKFNKQLPIVYTES